MEKILINKESIKKYTNYLSKLKVPYVLTVSNYTIKLESEIMNYQFLRNKQSFRVFGAFSKIKKDLANFPIPATDKDKVIYFQHDIRKDFNRDVVYSIDLKSAYSTTMMLRNLLSADTYNYIVSLPKQDRLACVGMLASCKEIFYFNEENKIEKHETTTSLLEGFFYQCAKDTFQIISGCRSIAKSDYIFSWVDCIYLSSPDNIDSITAFLTSEGFNFTIEVLKNFKAVREKEKISISFWKEKGDRCTYKPFNLPHNRSFAAKQIIDYLLNVRK